MLRRYQNKYCSFGLYVSFKWSKTNQMGTKVLALPLLSNSDHLLCPVRAYLKMGPFLPAPAQPLPFYASGPFWPRLFKERISPIQRINQYPVDKIYPLAPSRSFERWIALSTRYPADKFIHGKVGSINFYPPDKRHKHGRSTVASFTEQLVTKLSKPTSQKKENFPPAA